MNQERFPALPEADVVVIGAGPVGSLLAIELARHGVRSTVVERTMSAPEFPKMDFLNGRSMELLRRIGLADVVRAEGVDPTAGSDFLWTVGFDRPPASVWHYPSPREMAAVAEATVDGSAPLEVYQRITGSLLEDLLRRTAAGHPLITLLEGWTFTGRHSDGWEVVSVVSRTGTARNLRGRYLVGCDGAGSAVRDWLGIGEDVLGEHSSRCSVHFTSTDPALRQYGSAFLTLTATGLTLVSRDERGTWTGSFPVPADEPFVDDPIATIAGLLGTPFTVDAVHSVRQWRGCLAVADRYRKGSVFLAGDAAHQFLPFGGHGANTGIADAVDLAWKLAARLQGWGGEVLLDSYEAERRPVALVNREMCADLLEVARRFGRLAAGGAPAEQLGGFLRKERHQVQNLGVHFGYRYNNSPVVATEPGVAPRWEWGEIVPSTWPGVRPPSVRLADGSEMYDRFGPGLTLVDMSGTGAGAAAAAVAAARGVPLTLLRVDDEQVRRIWQRDLVLIRPDQHVAWRGAAVGSEGSEPDWNAVLDIACGHAVAEVLR